MPPVRISHMGLPISPRRPHRLRVVTSRNGPRLKSIPGCVLLVSAMLIALAFGARWVADENSEGRGIGEGGGSSFRSLDGPAESMPESLAKHLVQISGFQRSALQTDTTQHLIVGGQDIWIATFEPPNAVCLLVSSDGAVACSSASVFRRKGLAIGTFSATDLTEATPPEAFRLLGIAPDSVRMLRVKVGRKVVTRPVRANAYAMTARSPISVLALERRPGR